MYFGILKYLIQAVGECSQQYPTEVIVYLKSTTNSETAVNLTTISSNSAVLSGLTNAVPSDKRYTLDVTVTNTAGSISSTSTTTISECISVLSYHINSTPL